MAEQVRPGMGAEPAKPGVHISCVGAFRGSVAVPSLDTTLGELRRLIAERLGASWLASTLRMRHAEVERREAAAPCRLLNAEASAGMIRCRERGGRGACSHQHRPGRPIPPTSLVYGRIGPG